MDRFRFFKQSDKMDCGPTCLKMIMVFYGHNISTDLIRKKSFLNKKGTTIVGLGIAAEELGFKSIASKLDFQSLIDKAPLPCIISWNLRHLVVLYKITKKFAFIADPEIGKRKISLEELRSKWLRNNENSGIVLLLEPTPEFYQKENEEVKSSFSYFIRHFYIHKNLLFQIFAAVIFTSLLSLVIPFITQSVVDIGILGKNIKFIYLILLAQLVFTIGGTVVTFIQSWITLHLSIRISLSFVIGYISKLLSMPFSFFEIKSVGDIVKRIGDNSRVENFLKNTFFTLIISVFNFIIFSSILGFYDFDLLLIFLLGNFFYIGWILLFLKKRREFDFARFQISAESENKLLQLYYGAREIILNNIQKEKRWEWERVQAKSYELSKRILVWEQFQASGATIINSVVGTVISIMVASAVIDGKMTLGMMMSVQFIMGQIQAPLKSFLSVTHSYQDAKISLERLSEVIEYKHQSNVDKYSSIPDNAKINIENVSFQYDGPTSPTVLKDINLTIPFNKKTAIVGMSGSGKTSILKLLLKLYTPTDGKIKINDLDLEQVDSNFWRENCGVVMQDDYIFADSIINNIVLKTYDSIELDRLHHSIKLANLKEWLETLPLGYNTILGKDGAGMSQGQKQRLLIARALYKNPKFLFFDEATNALDSENENQIMSNIFKELQNKTIIIVAHRLSTVINVDNIVVLSEGKIVEEGTHSDLIKAGAHYSKLFKNQIF